ncbi:uncharacterized protein F5891DRAFT_1174729 [Suillus fuscotomentosus]|uniref:Uncharacterized protein n=1 Tax=Suillus fuscotomentosus TaxID=1912939 RepID=A0AAD4E0C6_9AGAM|nr:uncharacterized protein F5891DRAFT_1174729 [Suillus fuscotomentosus]KAG1897399.1 hypothetical protein F5891DRAFT_1174729 [Suillus fuscotomentosus]
MSPLNNNGAVHTTGTPRIGFTSDEVMGRIVHEKLTGKNRIHGSSRHLRGKDFQVVNLIVYSLEGYMSILSVASLIITHEDVSRKGVKTRVLEASPITRRTFLKDVRYALTSSQGSQSSATLLTWSTQGSQLRMMRARTSAFPMGDSGVSKSNVRKERMDVWPSCRGFQEKVVVKVDARIKTIELKKSELCEAKEMCNCFQIVVLEVIIFVQDNTSAEDITSIMIQNFFNEGNSLSTVKERAVRLRNGEKSTMCGSNGQGGAP